MSDAVTPLELNMETELTACYQTTLYEIGMCPHLNVSVIHIFKAAGTTTMKYLQQFCKPIMKELKVTDNFVSLCDAGSSPLAVLLLLTLRVRLSPTNTSSMHIKYYVMSPGHFKIRKGDPILKIETVDSGPEMLRHTDSFSFVRDPVARFVSGLAETHKRRAPWALQVEKDADESGQPITTVAIESLFRTPLKKINPHLAPQSWSLTDCNGKAMNTITHIGLVSEGFLHDTISGILKAITPNKTRAQEWSHEPIYTRSSRDENKNTFGHFGTFESGFVERLHEERIPEETVERINEFYAIDRECLGLR